MLDFGLLDYDTATSHNVTVRALSTDGSFSLQTFTINILDVGMENPLGPAGPHSRSSRLDWSDMKARRRFHTARNKRGPSGEEPSGIREDSRAGGNGR